MEQARGIRAARADATRDALISVARRLFSEKGFHDTGTHEIVAAAGVTRGALQHHFPRKEDLFRAAFEAVERDLMAAMPTPPPGTEWRALQSALEQFFESAARPEVQRILLIDGPAVLGWATWRQLEAEYGLGVIVSAVENGIALGHIRPQPARPLALMILSILDEGALMVAHASDPQAAKAEARVALATLLSSLA